MKTYLVKYANNFQVQLQAENTTIAKQRAWEAAKEFGVPTRAGATVREVVQNRRRVAGKSPVKKTVGRKKVTK